MEKLTPQNEHEEHMVQVLLAIMQGIPVQYKGKRDGWTDLQSPILHINANTEYFIVHQSTPLPISREMLAMISPEWKFAAMNVDKGVTFFTHKPILYKQDGFWGLSSGTYCNSVLVINTDGINWEQSLTERPEDV